MIGQSYERGEEKGWKDWIIPGIEHQADAKTALYSNDSRLLCSKLNKAL